jgi:anti-sigma factor RsiW
MDGELPPAQAADLHRHVAGCRVCRRELSRLRQTTGLVGSLAEVAPPQDLRARVQQKAALARPSTLTCASARELLDEYAHGEVEDEVADRIVAHLNECPPCSREMARLEQTAGLLTALSSVEPPARIRQRVQAEMAPRSRPIYARPTFRGLAATAATAVAVAAVMIALRIPTVTQQPVVATKLSAAAPTSRTVTLPTPAAAPKANAALTPATVPAPSLAAASAAARPVRPTLGAVALGVRAARTAAARPAPAAPATAVAAAMRAAASHLAPGAALDTPIASVPMETPAPHVTTASAGPAVEPEPVAAMAELTTPRPAREVTVAAVPAAESPLSEVRRIVLYAPRANPPTLRPKQQLDRLASSPIKPWGF